MVHEKGWVQETECFQGTFPDRPNFGSSKFNKKRGKSISIWLIFLLIS